MSSAQTAEHYVFISYSRRDAAFVNRLRADLEQHGLKYWIDKDGIRPGNPNWERAIRDAIRGCSAVICVGSPSFVSSDVVPAELALARNLGRRIYPVWAEGSAWVEAVPFEFFTAHYADLRGEHYAEGLADLLAALRGASEAQAEGETPPPPARPLDGPTRNPYKGLRAFTEADAGDYFGRSRLVAALVEMLRARLAGEGGTGHIARFLTVIGPSGSGKSSAVMAGLLPALKRGALPGSDRWTVLPPVLPESDPLSALVYALRAVMPGKRPDELRRALDAPHALGLHDLATELCRAPGDRVVVFIDQFEEVFTLVDDEARREQFIQLLVNAAAEPDGPCVVILTLRADFYDRPMNYPMLGALVEANNRSVLPMSLAELLEAITEPARLPDVQLSFEGELAVEIAFDLLDSRATGARGASLAGALPLLQFALERLYVNREGFQMSMAAYAAMGRVTGAIGQHAEDVFTSLDDAAQKGFARVFYRLVNIDDQGTPTRRRCARADATDGDPAAERLVGALIDNRLLIAERDNIIEVAHEALLRSWGRLATWIETTADDIWWLQKVGAAAAEWERAERPERLLWDYEDLHLVYGAIERLGVAVEPRVAEFIRPQTDRLLAEFRTAPEYRQLSILDRLAEIGADAAGALVAGLAAAKGEVVRAGIDAILWTIPEAAARELIAVLGRRETNLRRAAADAAGRLGVASTVPALVENLRDPALNNKQPELKALAALVDAATAPQVVPALIAMLRAERWEERALAADSLGALGALDEAGELPALAAAGQALTKLVYDARGEVRQAAIRALGRVGAPTVVGLLLARLRDTQPTAQTAADREALIGALAAMGEVNGRNLLDESTRFRVRNALIEAASAPEDTVRAAAAEAFGKLRDNGVIAQLSFMLRDPESARVREAAATTIGVLEHTHGVRPLLNTLTDASPLVRTAAVRALGAFKGRDDIRAPLRALLFNDADARPRAEAALVLGAARDSNATDALNRALADKNITVQIAAIEALGMLKAVGATDSLVRIVRNKKIWALRQAAATAVARIGTHQGRASLIELAAGRDFDAALASAAALTILGHADESTTKALYDGLADPRPEVRRAAAEAFGALKYRPAAEAVLALLRDPDADVRAAASEALRQIAELGIIPALRELRASPLLGVARAASTALAALESRAPQAARTAAVIQTEETSAD